MKRFWKGVIIGLIIVSPFWFWGCLKAFGATYHIAASGADATTYTNLITAINHLVPGDNVYFNRGETFSEQVVIATSGTSGNVITLGAYGSGALPIITNGAGTGILSTDKEYLTIENLHIKDCGGDGIDLMTTAPVAAWGDLLAHHMTVDSCTVTGSVGNGVFISGHYATIKNCTLTDNGDNSSHHNIYLKGSNALVEDNICSDSAQGIGLKYMGADSTFQRNWIENNHFHGISYSNDHVDTFSGNICRYNVIICTDFNDTPVGDPAGINIYSSAAGNFTGINIYNNTIYGYDDETANQISGILSWEGGAATSCTNLVIKNNIIWASDYAIGIVGTPAGFASDYNQFYDFTSFYYDAGAVNWATWSGTYDTNGASGDPLFTDVASGDFTLRSDSPCIEKGTNVGIKQDFYGTHIPQGLEPDIGAIEYIVKQDPTEYSSGFGF